MDKLLTVIIPCYNSRKFLEKGLSSLLCGHMQERIEVIVVNDGSTDGGEEICARYIEEYPEIFRIIHKENGGHGSAINAGVSKATGKYIKVLDADDWVNTESMPEFLSELEKLDAQVVLTHHHTIDISTGEVKSWKSYPQKFGKPYSFKEIMADWKSFDRSLSFHGISYSLEFYREKGMKLSEKVFYEDHEYATVPCCFAETIVPLNIFVYEYRIGDQSQSVSSENQVKRISHTQTVIERLLKEQERLKYMPEDAWGLQYYRKKTHLLLLSFLVTSLLCDKDRKTGRRRAAEFMELVKEKSPIVWEMTKKHYLVLRTLNIANIGIVGYTKILNSRLYNRLRSNRDFA